MTQIIHQYLISTRFYWDTSLRDQLLYQAQITGATLPASVPDQYPREDPTNHLRTITGLRMRQVVQSEEVYNEAHVNIYSDTSIH